MLCVTPGPHWAWHKNNNYGNNQDNNKKLMLIKCQERKHTTDKGEKEAPIYLLSSSPYQYQGLNPGPLEGQAWFLPLNYLPGPLLFNSCYNQMMNCEVCLIWTLQLWQWRFTKSFLVSTINVLKSYCAILKFRHNPSYQISMWSFQCPRLFLARSAFSDCTNCHWPQRLWLTAAASWVPDPHLHFQHQWDEVTKWDRRIHY